MSDEKPTHVHGLQRRPNHNQPFPVPIDTAKADRKLLIGGAASIALILISLVLRMTGVLPSTIATVAILIIASLGVSIFVRYAAKSASSGHRARVTRGVSLVGLGVSLLTVFSALPVLLRGGGLNLFSADILAHMWTVLILVLVVGNARTIGWQTLFGMSVTAFLGITALAYAVGRPVSSALGTDSTLLSVIYVPVTEELLKALPAAILLLFAVRNKVRRPSAVEMALLGACLGGGFALYENTQFQRGGFDWGAMPLVSLINPTASSNSGVGLTYVVGGHMIFTALLVFGLAIGVLYRRTFQWAKLAILVALLVTVTEHATQNYSSVILAGEGNSAIFNLLRVLTLWGWLSSLLLIGGIAWFARWKGRRPPGRRERGLRSGSPRRSGCVPRPLNGPRRVSRRLRPHVSSWQEWLDESHDRGPRLVPHMHLRSKQPSAGGRHSWRSCCGCSCGRISGYLRTFQFKRPHVFDPGS